MLKMKDISTVGFAKYILGDVAKLDKKKGNAVTDYYSKNDSSATNAFEDSFRYFGSGFKQKGFELSGDYSKDPQPFINMFHGLDPFDKEKKLVENALTDKEAKAQAVLDKLEKKRRKEAGEEPEDPDKKKIRRVGADLCFSMPNELSIALASAQIDGNKELEDKLLGAHRQAVNFALTEIEKNLVVQRGKRGTVKEKGIKAFIFQADHFDARPVELEDENGDIVKDGKRYKSYVDMNGHTHCILMNYAIAPSDGKVVSLDSSSLSKQINLGTANYRMKLAELLQSDGQLTVSNSRSRNDYGFVKKVVFALNGVSKEASTQFSKRSKKIKEHVAKHGGNKTEAALATRHGKNSSVTYDEHRASWKEQIDELKKNDPDCINIYGHENKVDEILCDSDLLDLTHKIKGKVTINEFDLRAIVTENWTGYPEAQKNIDETVKRILSNPDLICSMQALDGISNKQYSSMKLVQADLQIQKFVTEGANSREHDLDPALVEQKMAEFEQRKGFALSDEQRNAIVTATQGRDGKGSGSCVLISGLAGTGKSVLSRVVTDSYVAAGYQVLGVSVSALAAQNLGNEAGMESRSSAKFLYDYENGKIFDLEKVNPKTVIIFDEIGQAGLEMVATYAELAEKTGAHLILQGDARQLSSVTPGNALKLIEACISPDNRADLEDIRRQERTEDRDLALAFYALTDKESSEALYAELERAGYIEDAFKSNDQAVEKVAQDYVDNPAPASKKLVIASQNVAVEALNNAIQAKLIEKGQLGKDAIKTIGAYEFHEGDRVRFLKSKRLGKGIKAINGTRGTVVTSPQGSLMVKLDSGEVVKVPDDYESLLLDHAITMYQSQGMSKEFVYPLIDSDAITNALALVSFTRMKSKIHFYGTTDNLESLKYQMHICDQEQGAFDLLDETSKTRARNRQTEKQEAICDTREKDTEAKIAIVKEAMKKKEKDQTGTFEGIDTASKGYLIKKIKVEFMNTVLDEQSIDIERMANETDAELRERKLRIKKQHAEALTVSQPAENIPDEEIKRLKDDLDNEADSRYGNENISHGTYIKTGKTGIAWEEEQKQIALKAQEERVRQERTQSEQTEQEASPGPANPVEPPPLPIEKKPPYAFLAGVVSHYGLATEQSLQGFSVTKNSNKIIHIDTNKAVSVSVASLATNHAYDVIGELAKNNHFDKNKAVEISVNENLENFNEAQQRRCIERMLETLLASGIDVDMITIKNEKFKALLDEAKEKNFMSIRQIEVQAEQKPTPLPEVEANPTTAPKAPKPVGVDVDKLFNGKATQFQEDIYDEVMNRTEAKTDEQPKEKSPAEKYKETLAQQLDDNRAKASDKRMPQSDKHDASVTETEKKKKKTSFKPK